MHHAVNARAYVTHDVLICSPEGGSRGRGERGLHAEAGSGAAGGRGADAGRDNGLHDGLHCDLTGGLEGRVWTRTARRRRKD